MNIRKHKICDICKNEVGINNRYYTLKGKNVLFSFGGSVKDNRTIHICEDCLYVLKKLIIKHKA